MWFGGPPSKPGAKPGTPAPKTASPKPAVAPAPRQSSTRGFDRDTQHQICEALSKSGRLSYDVDRHPLVKFLKGGTIPTDAGPAPRVIVHARKQIREGRFQQYEVAFILHLDGTIEEVK